MRVFDNFDAVYCINLDFRTDRLENFQSQVLNYNLGEYTRISAVDGSKLDLTNYPNKLNPGELGLVLTNIEIIKTAKNSNFKKILIIEDDCEFSDEILKFDEYYNMLPDDWDMFYMGGNHNIHVGMDPPTIINDKVCKLHNTYSTHFVALKDSVFDHVLEISKKYSHPIDVCYVLIQQVFNVYSFYPAIAKQIVDYSNIQNKVTDYNWLIN